MSAEQKKSKPHAPKTNFVFNNEDDQPASSSVSQAVSDQPTSVTWTASEFINQDKSAAWFFTLGAAALVVAVIVYLLTRDKMTSVVILIVAIVFGFFAARRPRTLTYVLNHNGLQVGARGYPYELFKSFSILEEGALACVLLMPMRRFMPPLTLYYTPEDEDKILDMLSNYLPFEERKRDLVDQAMRKIRF